MRRILPFVATLLLGFGLFVAAETVLPHDFEAGDLLSAAAMNENFAALAAAIDALAAGSQRRVAEACPAGSAIRAIGEDGGVTCEEDDLGEGGGGGDVTAVEAGFGLSGGGVSGDLALALDTDATDRRYYPRREVDELIANNPGPAGADGEDGANVSAALAANGDLTVCNDAGTPDESCTTENVRGTDGTNGTDGADGAPGVSGYEVYTDATDFGSPMEAGSSFTFGRNCPDDKKALGGGGDSSQFAVVIHASMPMNNGRGWRIDYTNTSDQDLPIEYDIYIVCADVE